MKRCYEPFFSTISIDAFNIIYERVDLKTQKNLSFTCKELAEFHLSKIQSLLLFIPKNPLSQDAEIFPCILKRYSKIKKLEIALNSFYTHLPSFISHLKRNPLKSVTKLVFNEMNHEDSKELNRSLLESIYHSKLESIVIRTLKDGSVLTKEEIQPFLNVALNLKKFTLICNPAKNVISVSFHNQVGLISAKFHHLCCPPKTIESLGNATTLQTLTIANCTLTSNSLLDVLSKKIWNLKRLILPNVIIDNDLALINLTKQFPVLEELDNRQTSQHPYATNLTGAGLKMIGENCKNLRVLRFAHWRITDAEIEALTQKLPHLEVLSFSRGYNITEVGVASIAKNCPKLHTLEMQNIKRILRVGIEALVQSSISLITFKLDDCGHLIFEDLRYLIKGMPKLTKLAVQGTKEITNNHLEILKTEFIQLL